jgi:membrane protein DedA with SNARE-associated domain
VTLELIVARYGLLAVFLGAGIEGEAVVLTAGVLAHRGLLPIWGVAIAASIGSCFADQLWFWMARHYRHARWVERATRRPAFKRALAILEHHLILFTLGFRFIYGMRTVTPIAISASKIRTRTFVLLNIVSAAIWGPIMAWLGYAFGGVIDPWLHGAQTIVLVIGAVAIILAIVAGRYVHGRRRARMGTGKRRA